MTRLFFILSFWLIGLSAFGQKVKFSATVNETTVALNQQFKYTLTIENARGSILAPNFDGFRLLQGARSEQSTSIINGKATTTFSQSYVLQPLKVGKFKIPPAKAKINGTLLESNGVTITVQKEVKPDGKNSGAMFLDLQLSKKDAYVGEEITLKYILYSQYNSVAGFESVDFPKMDGFWVEELDLDYVRFENTTVLNGKRYYYATIKKEVIYPQRSGEITIPVGSLVAQVQERVSFFNTRTTNYSAKSRPRAITVKPLPPKPPNFIGSFENLTLKAGPNRIALPANESINYTVKFSGKGNLKLIDTPQLGLPDKFEVYDPKIVDNISVSDNGQRGSRSFDFLAIPRLEGKYSHEAQTLSYFNTQKNKYEYLTLPASDFEITKGEAGAGANVQYNSKTDVNILNKDIRYIKTGPSNMVSASNIFFGTTKYYLMLCSPLVLLLGLFIFKRKQDTEQQDVAKFQKKKAGKNARKELANAQKLISGAKDADFYEALHYGLMDYLKKKLTLDNSQMNKATIATRLAEIGNPVDSTQINAALEKCEMARYGMSSGDKHADFETVSALINELENKLK